MSKKYILGTLACLTVIAVALLVWYMRRPPLAMEDVMPSDAIIFARLAHPANHLKEVFESPLMKALGTIDAAKVMARNGFANDKIAKVKQWQEKSKVFLNNPLLMKILSKEVAVAVYPPAKEATHAYEMLFALRLPASVAAAEFVGQMSKGWGNDVELRQDEYQGVKIQHVTLKHQGISFAYLRLRDLLVFVIEPSKSLERVIHAYHHELPSLAHDAHFIFVRQHAYANGEGLGFINMTAFAVSLKAQMSSWMVNGDSKETNAMKLEEIFDSLGAVYAQGISYAPGEISRYKIISGVDESKLTQFQRAQSSCKETSNASLNFVPANAIGYHWGSCYDFKAYWQQIRQSAYAHSPSLAQSAHQFKHRLEKRFKVNIENDILPALGNEVGGYLTDIDTQGLFPFPRMLIFIKIKNRASVDDLLQRLTANPMVIVQGEDYGKASIRYMSLPFGANMDLGYCFLGDYVLMATSRQLLKKSIDAYGEPERSLAKERTFKEFALGEGTKNNVVSFVKLGDMAVRAEALVEWMNKYLASQVSTAMTYKQEGEGQRQELVAAIEEQTHEMTIAEHKLKQLKLKPLADLPTDEAAIVQGSIDNLQKENARMEEEIKTNKTHVSEIEKALTHNEAQVKSANLVIFDMEKLVVPLLKGAQAFNAQGMRVSRGEHVWETEILFK